MEWLAALLETLVAPAVRWLRRGGTFVRNNPWRTVRLTVGAVVAVALVAASWFAISFFTAPVRIGGVDFVGFCGHHEFGQSSIESTSCYDAIDLDRACRWTYKEPALTHEFQGDTLYTADCRDADGASRGGIDNMTGYCRSKHATAADRGLAVEAVVDGGERIGEGTWICQAPADPADVCRYNYPGATKARRSDTGQWSCYGPKEVAQAGSPAAVGEPLPRA